MDQGPVRGTWPDHSGQHAHPFLRLADDPTKHVLIRGKGYHVEYKEADLVSLGVVDELD